jgi:hypothetical protein
LLNVISILLLRTKLTHISRRISRDKGQTGTVLPIANSNNAISVYPLKARPLCWTTRLKFLPVPPAATVVSATAKQQHQDNDNEDQFHGKSPLMVMT